MVRSSPTLSAVWVRMVVKSLAVGLTAVSISACFNQMKGSQPDFSDYRARQELADAALTRGDYDEVTVQLNAAEAIADRIEYNNGKVMVKSEYGQMYLIQHRSRESEAAYL
ncbi:MAG TPA: hypothetical protein VGI80_09575, partial [Pyrinomonadaceae bacterium]